jgi:hypothetical protein
MLGEQHKIQSLKELNITDDIGINIIHVLAVRLYAMGCINIIKRFVYSLFWSATIKIELNENAKLIIFHGCKMKSRIDYDQIIDHVRHAVNEPHSYIEIDEKLQISSVLNKLIFIFLFYRQVDLKGEVGFWGKLYILVLYSQIHPLFQQISIHIKNSDKLVTFCDAHPYDNYAAQLAKLYNVKTFTLQHGQYRILPDPENPDNEAYANFISDKLLCWGQATVNEFIRAGIEISRLEIVGWLKPRARLNKIKRPSNNCFGVLLGGNSQQVNLQLIAHAEILSRKLGLNYFVRLHPYDNQKIYSSKVGGYFVDFNDERAEKYYQSVDFNIAHMTGAIIESLENYVPCYIYKDNSLAPIFHVDSLNYEDVDQLERLAVQKYDTSELMELSSYFVAETKECLSLN